MNEKTLKLDIRTNAHHLIPKICVTDIDPDQTGEDIGWFWREKGARLFIEAIDLLKLIAADRSCEFSVRANQILEAYRSVECEEDEI